jgi:hypothetical protein
LYFCTDGGYLFRGRKKGKNVEYCRSANLSGDSAFGQITSRACMDADERVGESMDKIALSTASEKTLGGHQ